MRKSRCLICSTVGVVIMVTLFAATAYSQGLFQIILYKGETAGTGTGITACRLVVGEEMVVTAKGVDIEGKEVPIWPTWKADKELSITVKEGRSKTAIVKAISPGLGFFSAIYITDDGIKVEGIGECEIKAAK